MDISGHRSVKSKPARGFEIVETQPRRPGGIHNLNTSDKTLKPTPAVCW